ncbi:LuxR C-terminal-related transcriptional regulator [Pedobacter sp. SYSU D00535]|uniref:LuxR C-terminal-related transcriptional regulator n=1 Tax=Pedobacter sp. SYSU D00535 TaxID=2810308 RepID=UPI001A96FD95|nr:LuxR C-terminal-related transcriptional regulator [Pedobacter sp. SYSU D00535]
MQESLLEQFNQEDLPQEIVEKIKGIDAVANDFPGVIIIHNIITLQVVYMSERGQKMLGFSLKQLQELGPEYHNKFFNPEDAKDYIPQIMGLLQRNNTDEVISFFQQVRASEADEWSWYMSTIRILARNKNGEPLLTINFAAPIDPENHNTPKVQRLLDENDFLKKHYHEFSQLSEREQAVLKLLAVGKSSHEIARELFISTATADTHRRNIRQKLKANTSYELAQYARAFNLI